MAFTSKSQRLYSFLILLYTLHLLIFYSSFVTSNGYTTNLIHRDYSPLSPFYNPSITHFDRLQNAFQRSLKRIDTLKPTKKIEAPMKPGGGEYLMKMSLGTPPIEVIGIADTGSDLIWTQCLPCIECYNQTIPLFDPHKSSSYKTIPCGDSFCDALGTPTCDNSKCGYSYSYGDGSHTSGDLASDTLTVGNSVNSLSVPNVVFGCGHDTSGTFDDSGSGIIGLGGGKLSLISQLGQSISGKFSYCLVPTTINSTSVISFGPSALISDPQTVTIPIFKTVDTFYFVKLEAFSVGKQRIEFESEASSGSEGNPDSEGNIIIDSGTTMTLLPSKVYENLELALVKVIRGKRVKDPKGLLGLCYESNGENIKLPIITAHFQGGDLNLQPLNTFSWVREDVVCFTMISDSDLTIYGNLAQTNFLIGFDVEASTISFKPTNCAQRQ